MRERYKMMQTPDGATWIKQSQVEKLRQVDAIAFDCDGVLVDARKSYDATIPRVADQLLRMKLGIGLPWKQFAPKMITTLRQTGKFNNDWDTTYALILFSVVSLPMRVIQEIEVGTLSSKFRHFNYSKESVMAKIASTVKKFSSTPTLNRNISDAVDQYAITNAPSKTHEAVLLSLKNELGYPGSPPKALLSTLFDEVYHGPDLFRRMYGIEAKHYRRKGLIENERILIKRRDLTNTNRILGGQRLAIITGRPYLATKHVLNGILGYFNVQASLFLGDIDVHPELAPKLTSYRKPNGEGLSHVRQALSSNTLLYVGDSAEDIEMVENARREHEVVLSAGIYGTSLNQSAQLRFFLGRGTDIILPSARRISDILRMVKHEKRAD